MRGIILGRRISTRQNQPFELDPLSISYYYAGQKFQSGVNTARAKVHGIDARAAACAPLPSPAGGGGAPGIA